MKSDEDPEIAIPSRIHLDPGLGLHYSGLFDYNPRQTYGDLANLEILKYVFNVKANVCGFARR